MSTSPRLRDAAGTPIDALGQYFASTPYGALYGQLWSHGVVEQATKEVARLRNATITDCGL
jgi:hypothetical protein